MNTFSQRLKKAMDEQRVTQSDLSSMTGLGKSSISQYLSGKNEPKVKTMTLIADALNVSVDWLSGAVDEPSDDGSGHTNNLPVETAARLMGVGKQFIRVGLQKGILPFGYAVKLSANRFTYYISPKKFTEYTGITID